ncbi:hypothetical protein LIER_36335 [Lithospermum erythrorhizon]|uniref:Uncharacterized protein n=1 Tax=Lithospermum erythrorhizon TaxID=34254 RepID=A0AAV3P691_LITER
MSDTSNSTKPSYPSLRGHSLDPPTIREMGFLLHLLGRQTPHASTLLHRRGILKATGLFPITDVDLGALESLRVTFNVPDHAPVPPPAIPAASFDQLPLRGGRSGKSSPEKGSPPPGESTALGPHHAALEPQGVGVNKGLMGNLSTSPHPEPGEGLNPLLPTNHAPAATPVGASINSATVVLEP